MSSIVANQRSVNQTRASDAARRLVDAMRELNPAEQAATLAVVAAAAGCPVDSVYLTGRFEDALDAAAILDGVLARDGDERWAWRVSSGCRFFIEILPKEAIT